MNGIDQVHRTEKVSFTCTGGTAALIHAADSSILCQNHRAAGEGLEILGLTYLYAWDICDGVIHLHPAWGWFMEAGDCLVLDGGSRWA